MATSESKRRSGRLDAGRDSPSARKTGEMAPLLKGLRDQMKERDRDEKEQQRPVSGGTRSPQGGLLPAITVSSSGLAHAHMHPPPAGSGSLSPLAAGAPPTLVTPPAPPPQSYRREFIRFVCLIFVCSWRNSSVIARFVIVDTRANHVHRRPRARSFN